MRGLEDSVYRIGEAQVSVSTRTVCRNGESVRLRPKNFDLLVYLIRCRGRIATKDEIFEEVWPDVAVTENSLVKCISELRRVLGDDLRNPQFLRSVPKVGYELVGAQEECREEARPTIDALEVQETTTVAVEYREEISIEAGLGSKARRWVLAAAAVLLLVGAWAELAARRGPAVPPPIPWRETAWWKLDEAKGSVVRDAEGRLGGQITKSMAWTPEGLWLSGLDSAVTGRTRGVLPLGDSARTISAWIKIALPPLDATAIFNYGSGVRAPNDSDFSMGVNLDGRVGFGSHISQGSLLGVRRVNDGQWHMVTGTYDGPVASTGRIYVDGQLDSAQKLEVRPATVDGPFWEIGRYFANGSDFRGTIRDVRVLSRALTDNQIAALHSCTSGVKDVGDYYYLPVFEHGFVREVRAQGAGSTPLINQGADFGGMQLARAGGACATSEVEGATIGEDLAISLDVLTPTDRAGNITQAGPYFRTRRAGAGDGLMGGTSAGYWVQLQSNGMIKVRGLNPLSVVAFSPSIRGYRADLYHALKMEARGATLQVWLDGQPVTFDQGGQAVRRVPIPAEWDEMHIGRDQGAAGVAFANEDNRGLLGGQRVRNLQVRRLD